LSIIKELWIISENGIPLYNQKTADSIDSSLFSGFLSAIMSFAKAISDHTMDMFKLGDSTFFILKEMQKSLLFIGKSDEKVKEEKVRTLLFKIRNQFLELFDKVLAEWDGCRTDCFDSFTEVINLNRDEDNIVLKFKKLSW